MMCIQRWIDRFVFGFIIREDVQAGCATMSFQFANDLLQPVVCHVEAVGEGHL